MRKYLWLVVLCLTLGLCVRTSWVHASDNEDIDETEAAPHLSADVQKPAAMRPTNPADYLDGVIPQYIANNNGVAAAIGIVRHGQPSTFYYGEVVKGSGRKPDGATVFMIGSISKTFTGLLLALHSANNQVHPGNLLQNYAPAGITVPTFNGTPITLESLVTHTSGLPRNPVPIVNPGNFTIPELWDDLSHTALNWAPDSKYLYSNFAFALLGQAIAKAAGKSWHALVEQEIAAPLGMVDTKTHLTPDEVLRQAQGYRNGNPVPLVLKGMPAENPAGGLASTMDDMIKFLSFNMGYTQSSLNSLRQTIFTPLHQGATPNSQVAYAWQINPLQGTGKQVIWKNGAVPGFNSYIGFTSDNSEGVVVLLNFKPSTDPVNSLGTTILNYLVETPTNAQAAHPHLVTSTPNP